MFAWYNIRPHASDSFHLLSNGWQRNPPPFDRKKQSRWWEHQQQKYTGRNHRGVGKITNGINLCKYMSHNLCSGKRCKVRMERKMVYLHGMIFLKSLLPTESTDIFWVRNNKTGTGFKRGNCLQFLGQIDVDINRKAEVAGNKDIY